MSITLPKAIADYFAADQVNSTAVALCFAENATVKDERQTHIGRDAIRQWKEEASAKYSYTSEPFAINEEDDKTVVEVHVSGDFPGSPIDLRYAFVLDGDQIAQLEITL